MPAWSKALDQDDTLSQFLRFKEFFAAQGNAKMRNSAKPKGKGKGKGLARSLNQELGTGLNQDRPPVRDEQLYAGRTAQEVANVIARGGWVGLRQFGKHKGKIFTGTYKEGDLSCSRCGSATCRPWKEDCWVCGAALPRSGSSRDPPKKRPTGKEGKSKEQNEEMQDSADESDEYVLPKASDMASVKKRPPSSVATVLASASLKTSPSYADVVKNVTPADAPSTSPPPPANPPAPASDPDLLSGAAMGQVKALLATLPPNVKAREELVHLLERHRAAEARQKRQAAEAKSDTIDFTGKTYECILAHHESQLANLKKRAAENSARREADQASRRQELEKDRAKLQKTVDRARKELEEFDELTAVRAAEWEASEQAKAADLQEQIDRASEEVSRAKASLLAAPAPNTKHGQGGTPETGKGTEAGNGREECGIRRRNGDGKEQADVRQPPTPKHFTPMITPPKLQPPSDPTALARLQRALAVHQLWSVQEGEWPLTLVMLGLTTQELSQLVGNDIWARSPLVSEQASIPKSLAGSIAIALNGLEVSAAAEAAAQGAVRQVLEAQQTTSTLMESPTEKDEIQATPGNHARTDTGVEAGVGSDVDM